jgi:dTDP-4-amino-4,6-dideoxygalactose transaminase
VRFTVAVEVTQTRSVPFLDLSTTHAPIKERLLDDLDRLVESGEFTNGPPVAAFEDAFAAYHRAARCVGVANGLDALRLALIGLGLERGDEVVVPATTFVATFEAVTQAGGVPVPVDIRPDDYTLDLEAVQAALTARTRAIMPVHLYGQMADMVGLCKLAEPHGLAIVEDAAQAHGAVRDGLLAGTAGTAGAFSFYPGKNLGAMGDAGALITGDAELAERVRALREHGQRAKYDHEVEGYTSRLDTMQALVLLHKLPHLDEWNAQRRSAAVLYGRILSGFDGLGLPRVAAGSNPVWHLYVVRARHPNELAGHLSKRGIGTGRHYPIPPHLSGAYAWLGCPAGSFPVTEALAAEALSLPIFPGITESQVESVAEAVLEYFNRG